MLDVKQRFRGVVVGFMWGLGMLVIVYSVRGEGVRARVVVSGRSSDRSVRGVSVSSIIICTES